MPTIHLRKLRRGIESHFARLKGPVRDQFRRFASFAAATIDA
ncbi:hypothetical protein [Caballeronia grimmiae]